MRTDTRLGRRSGVAVRRFVARAVCLALVAALAAACAWDTSSPTDIERAEWVEGRAKPQGIPAPASFACGDLTENKIAAWNGTIAISFYATDSKGDQISGSASYTIRYSNDATNGVGFGNWGPATDSWKGGIQSGSGQYKATYPPTQPGGPTRVDQGDGSLLPLNGHYSYTLPELDLMEVDPKGCRFLLYAGVIMRLVGSTATVGFGGNPPSLPIPASATELSGSYTIPLPNCATSSNCMDDPVTSDRPAEFLFNWQRSGETPNGSVTVSWKLVPVFRGNMKIASATLLDIDDQPLGWLSASPCDAANCGGNPRMNGSISVMGDADDSLTNLTLDVVQGGAVVASEALARDASAALPLAFGNSGTVNVAPQMLFELTPGEAAKIDQTSDARLTLRVHATSARGREATLDVASVPKLVRYTGTNRYGPRDANRGGDSWIKPSVGAVLSALGGDYLWSDMSNMNGGSFYPPHKSHEDGNNADGRFADGSIEHDWATLHHHTAATAQKLLSALSDATNGPRIVCIGLTYTRSAADPFWTAIQSVTLPDGRRAPAVIRPWHGHETHFHFRISDAADHAYPACPDTLPDGVP